MFVNLFRGKLGAPMSPDTIGELMAAGPAKKTRVNMSVQITHQQPPPSRALTQQQRLAWLRELVDGDCESLAYRVAGILLLLFGQPLTKIAALPTAAITVTENDMRISLGQEPIPVPQPFADLLCNHMASRQNLGATAGGHTMAIPQQPARPAPRPKFHHDAVAQPRHQPTRSTQHRAAKPRRRTPTTPGRRAPRLQLQHHPAPR